MDHSVEGYMQRLSSEDLEVFLLQCMRQNRWADYEHIVPQIIEILQTRRHHIPQAILDSWDTFQQ